jgi:cob(I)alamin adenosyltransferase
MAIMLYTGKGDNGTTRLFDSSHEDRLAKSHVIFDALGTLDELNCCLGYASALARQAQLSLVIDGRTTSYSQIIDVLQDILFSATAEIAGSPVRVKKEHAEYAEMIIAVLEVHLPQSHAFVVAGGSLSAGYLDVCRTVARRAERTIVALRGSHARMISPEMLQFLNRLSSVLYGLARYANVQEKCDEHAPRYE